MNIIHTPKNNKYIFIITKLINARRIAYMLNLNSLGERQKVFISICRIFFIDVTTLFIFIFFIKSSRYESNYDSIVILCLNSSPTRRFHYRPALRIS